MGRKVHPVGFRIGGIRDWQAKWFGGKDYSESLKEDFKLRKAIQGEYTKAAVSQIQIDRQANMVAVTVHTARPGVVIGRGGQRVDKLRLHLESLIGKKIQLNIQEIQQPELDSYLVARTIADQMESRISYRRAMKQAISRTIMAGAKGIRVSCAGRLGGTEIARRQTMHDGQVPLHTMRADIDYGFAEAQTTLGRIGVKVWIYKGDILPEVELVELEEAPPEKMVPEAAEIAKEAVTVEVTPEPEVTEEEKPPEPVTVESTAATTKAKPKKKPPKKVTVKGAKVTTKVKEGKKPTKQLAKKEVEAEVKKEKPVKPAVKRKRKTESAETKKQQPKVAKATTTKEKGKNATTKKSKVS